MLALLAITNTPSVHAFEAKDIAHDSTGVLDAPMTMMRRDGRNHDEVSVFEEMRLRIEAKKEHPMLSTHGTDVDVSMEMLWDWNHVIEIKMAKSNDTLQVIPDTGK